MNGTVTASSTALHFLVIFALSQATCFSFSKDIIRLFFSSKNAITAHSAGIYGIDALIYGGGGGGTFQNNISTYNYKFYVSRQ
jgi:hypothetical protein